MNARPYTWPNARRQRNAQWVVAYLWANYSKVYIRPEHRDDLKCGETRTEIAAKLEIKPNEFDDAVDDLYEHGLIDLRESGGYEVIELIDADLDGAAGAVPPAPTTPTTPRFTLRKGDQHGNRN